MNHNFYSIIPNHYSNMISMGKRPYLEVLSLCVFILWRFYSQLHEIGYGEMSCLRSFPEGEYSSNKRESIIRTELKVLTGKVVELFLPQTCTRIRFMNERV
jgi:hypothetical protein